MGKSIEMRASKFRFQGTRFVVFLRDEVIKIHNFALRHMLETLVEKTPNFTGETQATFRQFRDYLAKQNLDVQLKDVTRPEVERFKFRFSKSWHIPEKIANLPEAGHTTALGGTSAFSVVIERQRFSIIVNFQSGSAAFDENPDLENVFQEAKEQYKEFFADGLRLLFDPFVFTKRMTSFFNRVDIRSS